MLSRNKRKTKKNIRCKQSECFRLIDTCLSMNMKATGRTSIINNMLGRLIYVVYDILSLNFIFYLKKSQRLAILIVMKFYHGCLDNVQQ